MNAEHGEENVQVWPHAYVGYTECTSYILHIKYVEKIDDYGLGFSV